MTTITTTEPITATPEDQALKAKHAAMWASGSYRTVVDEIVGPLGGILVETVEVQRRTARPRRRRRDRQLSHSGRSPGRRGDRHRPDPRTARRRPCRGRRRGSDARPCRPLTPRRCRTPTASSTPCISSIGVMFAPHHQAGRRRTRPGLPAGRDDRGAELDAGGLHRPDVRGDEAVRAAASARRVSGAAVGTGRPRPDPVRGPGDRPGRPRSRRCASTASPTEPSSATSSRPTTARRSRCTASSPTTPRRSPRWTPTWPPSGSGS